MSFVLLSKPLKLTSRFVKPNLPCSSRVASGAVLVESAEDFVSGQGARDSAAPSALSATDANQAVSQAAAASSATLNYPN